MAFSTHDIVPDSPTNNFCTMNPLAYRHGHNGIQYSEGNLRVVQGTSAISYANFTTKSGKWYWEIFIEDNGTVANSDYRGLAEPMSGQSSDGWGNDCFLYNSYNGTYRLNTGSFTASDIGTANNPNIIGFFWDADNGYMTVSVNGVSGTTITGLSTGIPMCPAVNCNYDTIDIINFGQDPTFGGNKNTPATVNGETGPFAPSGAAAGTAGLFYYPPPTGALALCTANLPDFTPTVVDDTPQDYFKTVIWSGTTYSNATVPVGFTPDFVWAKAKNINGNHRLVDSVRGGNGSLMYELSSNDTGVEGTDSSITGLSNNGINLSSGNFGAISGQDFVAWCWKAGGSPSATDDGTGVSGSAKLVDTSGAASSTTCKSFKDAAVTAGASNVICPSKMSINQAAGFSIVKYAGNGSNRATVPHGLDKPIEVLLVKQLSDTSSWVGYGWNSWHIGLSNDNYIALNTTSAEDSFGPIWVTNGMTDKVFTHGDVPTIMNRSSGEYIAYCWNSVEGFSKFGSYVGNGSADGPFVYCGFRPAWVMIKNVDVSSSWSIFDSARDDSNVVGRWLAADISNSEQDLRSSHYPLDFLSNGFKLRTDLLTGTTNINLSNTYIFMAFSEQPFKFSNAR